MSNTLLYLRIMFSGIPVIIAYNMMACMLRSVGDSKTPLYAMILASLTNISLDLLFVCIFRWGIAGAAAATLAAQGVSVLYCGVVVSRIDCLHTGKGDFIPERPLAVHLTVLGLPMAFQNFIIAVGSMIVQSLINTYGVLFIAGFTATNKLYGLLEIAATSYGFAMLTYAGQNLGAGRFDRIRHGLRGALEIAAVTSILLAVFLLVCGKSILSLFISGPSQEAEETLRIAYRYLSVMSICLPVLYVLHVVRSTLQGMGDTISPLVSGFSEFLMRTGCVLFLPLLMGSDGVFFAEVLAWTGADIILIPSCIFRLKHLPETAAESLQ